MITGMNAERHIESRIWPALEKIRKCAYMAHFTRSSRRDGVFERVFEPEDGLPGMTVVSVVGKGEILEDAGQLIFERGDTKFTCSGFDSWFGIYDMSMTAKTAGETVFHPVVAAVSYSGVRRAYLKYAKAVCGLEGRRRIESVMSRFDVLTACAGMSSDGFWLESPVAKRPEQV